MGIFDTFKRINQLHSLIKTGKTGSPETLAKQLGVSRSTLYNLLNELKAVKAPIIYSRTHKSFLYTKEFNMELKCTIVTDQSSSQEPINLFQEQQLSES